MLEFIILGEIPGTSFRISFNGVLLVALTFMVAFETYRLFRRKQKLETDSNSLEELSI